MAYSVIPTQQSNVSRPQCMCTSSSDIGEVLSLDIVTISAISLERLLGLEKQIYEIKQRIEQCDRCSSDPSSTIEVFRRLDQLSMLYKAAQTTYAFSKTPDHRNDAANEEAAGHPSGIPRLGKSPIRLGRFELGEDESDIVGRILVKQGLSRIHWTIKAMRRQIQNEIEGVRGSDHGMHLALAQVAEINHIAEGILSRIWETIAQDRL